MADKYGPIFTVKFGTHSVLVSLAVEILGYSYAIFGLGPYGPYWRKMRKIVVLELLSNHRVQMYRHIREFEVKTSIKRIYERWSKERMNGSPNIVKIEMKQRFKNLIMTIIVRMLFGKEHDLEAEGKRATKAIRKMFKLLGTFVIADFIPSLRWFDIGRHEKEMKENAKEIDYFLEKRLVEHKKKRSSGERKNEDEKDFMDIMLSLFEGATHEDLPGFDADTIIKATCLAMLAGGTDTTVIALTWTLFAREELDIQVGKHTLVNESHIKNLVYLQAIVKESLRLYPPAPLSGPHESMEDCVVGGYNIPKGTRVLFNLWKIQRDPTAWAEPHLFKPERFLTIHKEVDVKGNHFELIPFSGGRRICPGISSALVLLHLTLANVLHAFEITKPSDEPMDMTESFGMTNPKATPLEVLVAPKLSSNLYK
ncbi:unnamed protein product [Withania somnifera]